MKKDRDFGKPNLIYLGKVVLDDQEKPILQFKNCKNYNSVVENNTGQNMENLQLINNTNINNLNKNNTKISQSVKMSELAEIKGKCELDLLEETDGQGNIDTRKKEMVENAIEIMYYSENIKVGNAVIPQEIVRNKLKLLNGAKIFYALDKLRNNLGNTQNVTNSTKYLIACLFNAVNEYHSDAELQYGIECSDIK